MPMLQKLFLNRNLLGDEAAKAIADVVMQGYMTEIDHLRLDNNEIGNPGAQALCDMLKVDGTLPNLEVFTLQNNNMSLGMYEHMVGTLANA